MKHLTNASQKHFAVLSTVSIGISHLPINPIQHTDIYFSGGEYLMNISIGTLPFQILAIADTGSVLIWTQCQPCTGCYQQVAPLFNPTSSSTYKDISCTSRQCETLKVTNCSSARGQPEGKCMYSIWYGDDSFSEGNLAADTVTLGSTDGSPLTFPNSVFGCGHHNNGGYVNTENTGIIGLDWSEFSLISQMGSSIGGKFSYCLVPSLLYSYSSKISSKINFGVNGVVSGSGVVSTPISRKDPYTFCYLTLEGISVDGKRLEFDIGSLKSSSEEEGNIIIDSGTTLTFLPQNLQSQLVQELRTRIQADPVDDPSGFLDLCYAYHPGFTAPKITVHFKGADVELKLMNTFFRIVHDGLVCLTFKGSNGRSIYGNLAQTNFLVGYDYENKTVSFKPTDCMQE